MFPIYSFLSRILALGARPYVTARLLGCKDRVERAMWQARFGQVDAYTAALGGDGGAAEAWSGAPRGADLWLHGVSVGEQVVLEPVVSELLSMRPDLKIALSAFTATGLERARNLFSGRCSLIAYPLDFPRAVRQAVEIVDPLLYASVETELWPNFIAAARRHGTGLFMLNGRISQRSFPRYMRVRRMVGQMLTSFSGICAISERYRDRFVQLGARPDRIWITGNAKYQGLLDKTGEEERQRQRERIRRIIGAGQGDLVWVCGSIRGREHRWLLEAYKAVGRCGCSTVMVLAPRHLDRLERLEKALKASGLSWRRWSDMAQGQPGGRPAVVLVDVVGELLSIYAGADLAFVGGSLEPLGGQNVMEPAAWGCPVFYGPHVDNFEDAVAALEKERAGIMLSGPDRIASVASSLMRNEALRKEAGARGRKALERLAGGAATRQAERLLLALDSCLSRRSKRIGRN